MRGRESGRLVAKRVGGGLLGSAAALWVGLGLGLVLGTAVTALAGEVLRDADSEEIVAAAQVWPHREIPLEWRWEQRPVKTGHMFRSRR